MAGTRKVGVSVWDGARERERVWEWRHVEAEEGKGDWRVGGRR